MRFIVNICREDPDLQIMYGIGGEKELTEKTLDHLGGYLRLAAGADRQRRLRPAPERRLGRAAGLDLPASRKRCAGAGTQADRRLIRYQVEAAIEAWPHPDQGIWESRGEPQHYVSSKLMIWVAVDRGARLARSLGLEEFAAEWEQTRRALPRGDPRAGVRDGVFRQHYDTDALDASLLLIPLLRFLPPDDPRVCATVEAIADQLTEHGLVLRYKVEETDDGLSGEEGTFLICSFWLVSALSEIGEPERARALCERLLAAAGLARPLRRGAGGRKRPPPRQLPPGLHPPGADQRRLPRDRRRAARGRRPHRGLHRDGRRPRGRLSADERPTDKTIRWIYIACAMAVPRSCRHQRPAYRPAKSAAAAGPPHDRRAPAAAQPAPARRPTQPSATQLPPTRARPALPSSESRRRLVWGATQHFYRSTLEELAGRAGLPPAPELPSSWADHILTHAARPMRCGHLDCRSIFGPV